MILYNKDGIQAISRDIGESIAYINNYYYDWNQTDADYNAFLYHKEIEYSLGLLLEDYFLTPVE